MKSRLLLLLWITLVATRLTLAAESVATLRIDASKPSPHVIPKFITGKFTEHLGNNVSQGIEAQVLRNPTFAEYPFGAGQESPDGTVQFHWERDKINEQIRWRLFGWGWPKGSADEVIQARDDGMACWWVRAGSRSDVQVSPDIARYGQRAQRVQVKSAGQGIATWTYLPLHRVRRFEFELSLRSAVIGAFTVSLMPDGGTNAVSSATVSVPAGAKGGSDWRVLRGTLEVPAGMRSDAAYRFAITASGAGQFVIGHAFLRPADHVGGADADVVRLLKESHLPIHRWPGGNFVSGYHWRDGVGPVEQRPALPNPAWGGIEPNTFGTDEFIALCRAIGCEPMICVNAGNGTPEEAAAWVEYCNGSATTPMGRLRAANGHPEPYHVKYWEVGNELWGRWQVTWTTGQGNADRYRRFSQPMLEADASISLYACGAPVHWGKAWNDTLIKETASILRATTDHPLLGGDVSAKTDPLDVFRDFMAIPDMLETKWGALRDQMVAAGIRDPRLAITELQLFAHIKRDGDVSAARLTHGKLVNPATLAEGLYDVLFYHAAVRLAPFVEMVTHSATVNHGGGLRKERERVYANPCYYAQAAFSDFAGATPVAIELNAPLEKLPRVLGDLRNNTTNTAMKIVDAIAARTSVGDLLVSIVHRAGSGNTRLTLEVSGFNAAGAAEVRTLSADVPWAVNSLPGPVAVAPVDSTAEVREGHVILDLKPYSVLRVRVPKG